MAKKPSRKNKEYTPESIVKEWRKEIKGRLKPWFLADNCYTRFEPKLRNNIKELLKIQPFTRADMRKSLRVARDAAKICRLLQPAPFPKKVTVDTFELVLLLTAKHHRVCQAGGGAGGWCDIGG